MCSCFKDQNQLIYEKYEDHGWKYSEENHLKTYKLPKKEYFKRNNKFVKFESIKDNDTFVSINSELIYLEEIQDLIKSMKVKFISHRWMSPRDPDPHKTQFSVIKRYLKQYDDDFHIFYDYSLIPQDGSKKTQLSHLDDLLSCCSVWVLPTDDYMNRSWCLFELFCGLFKLRPIRDISESGFAKTFLQQINRLSNDNIQMEIIRMVKLSVTTNKSDKKMILQKLLIYVFQFRFEFLRDVKLRNDEIGCRIRRILVRPQDKSKTSSSEQSDVEREWSKNKDMVVKRIEEQSKVINNILEDLGEEDIDHHDLMFELYNIESLII